MIRTAIISLSLLATPAFADGFAALAYDARAMVVGAATGATALAAQDAAMDVCGARAGNCKLRLTLSLIHI